MGDFTTGLDYKAGPRLRECYRQVEAEVVDNSRNKVHQIWELPYSLAFYSLFYTYSFLGSSVETEEEMSCEGTYVFNLLAYSFLIELRFEWIA